MKVDMPDLICRGERRIVIDYLTAQSWQVTAHTAKEMHERNGFDFPDNAMMADFGKMSYVTATLR